MAEGTALRVPSREPTPRPVGQVRVAGREVNPCGPIRDEQRLVPENGSLDARQVRHPGMGGCANAGGRLDQGRPLDQRRPVSGMATRKETLMEEGFDEQAIDIMLSNRAKSTTQRYEWH